MALDLEQVRGIAARVAADLGLEVVDLEYRSGGKNRLLRVFLDRVPGGVTHDDCVTVSRELSAILDVEGVVPGDAYMLEVSSPGLDRKLSRPEDFTRFTGRLVKILTRDPLDAGRHFEGRLEQFVDGRLTVNLSDRGRKQKKKSAAPDHKIEIELANIEKANLVPEI